MIQYLVKRKNSLLLPIGILQFFLTLNFILSEVKIILANLRQHHIISHGEEIKDKTTINFILYYFGNEVTESEVW